VTDLTVPPRSGAGYLEGVSTKHLFHKGLWVALAATAALALWTGCSAPAAAGDETHFLCATDADCKPLGDDRICEVRRCVQAPLGYPTSADGKPVLDLPASTDVGPTGDCTRVLPDDAASFETSARRLPPTTLGIPHSGLRVDVRAQPALEHEPVLSPNGHVILYGAATEVVGTAVRGHLVRWVDDSLTWHGESELGLILPRAVSCDGFTVIGHEASKVDAGAFPRSVRWRPVEGYETLPDDRFVQAISIDGGALYGVQLGTSSSTRAMAWREGAEPQVLLETARMAGNISWGRGGGSFLFNDSLLWFAKVGSGEPVSTGLACEVCENESPMRISSDGRAAAGHPVCLSLGVYVWTADGGFNQATTLGEPRAVISGGLAVGGTELEGGRKEGFVLDYLHRTRYFQEALADLGVEVPSSVRITSVSDVSDDGRVFTGICIDERDPGRQNIFRAVLPAGALERP
jgi:hypothetical protein